jgi:uncharacterized protein (DUF736 family)
MANFDNTNRGSISKNTKKEQPNHPDYRGSLNVEGHDYWISGWIKEGKGGEKFLSLSIRSKDEKKPAQKPADKAADSELDDEIPF